MAVEVVGADHAGLFLTAPEGEEKRTSTNPTFGGLEVGSLVEKKRLDACLKHYYERVRAVGGGCRQAA